MRYIHNTLLEKEELVFITRPHWIVFASPFFAFVFAALILHLGPQYLSAGIVLFGFSLPQLFALLVSIIGLYWLIGAFIMYRYSEYGITNKRVLLKTGLIQRKSLEIFLDKIEAVRIDQGVIGRLLNYGSIVVVGTGGTGDPFAYIPDPLNFRKKVQQQIDLVEHSRPH